MRLVSMKLVSMGFTAYGVAPTDLPSKQIACLSAGYTCCAT
jgi:hypothetical protein